MAKKFVSMHALMAGHGDCLWVEYGDENRCSRVLVDAGTEGTFKRLKAAMDQMPKDKPSHELFVVTHIDSDHIGGTLKLLKGYAPHFDEVWFNGLQHLTPGLQPQGALQGEKLTLSIRKYERPWNRLFGKEHVSITQDGSPVTRELPGGAKLTILSPGWPQLRDLEPVWKKEVEKAGLMPGVGAAKPVDEPPPGFEALGALDVDALAAAPFKEDDAKANGSSIAFLLEHGGKRVLFGADAHPTVLVNAIDKLTGGQPLQVDVFKLPHHGSKNNVSAELVRKVPAKHYLFSTNGAHFRHPDKEAVARVVKHAPKGAQLLFNCRTDFNKMWDNASLKTQWGYSVDYGQGDAGISLHLS
jgi:hypothetical protein